MAETISEYADIITVKDLQTGIVKYPRTITRAIIDNETGTTLSDHISVIEKGIQDNKDNFDNYYTAEEVDRQTEFSMFGTATEDPASILD